MNRLPRSYKLDDGTRIRLRSTVAWCADCAGLSTVEDLSLAGPLDDLRRAGRSLASVKARRSWFRTVWSCLSLYRLDDGLEIVNRLTPEQLRDLGTKLDRIRRQIDYLSHRTIPARCLSCGGQRLAQADIVDTANGHGYRHPDCGGVLHYTVIGSMNLRPSELQHIHGPDGTYLHDEECPYEAGDAGLM